MRSGTDKFIALLNFITNLVYRVRDFIGRMAGDIFA